MISRNFKKSLAGILLLSSLCLITSCNTAPVPSTKAPLSAAVTYSRPTEFPDNQQGSNENSSPSSEIALPETAVSGDITVTQAEDITVVFSDNDATVSGDTSNITKNGADITITEGGRYLISGRSENGSITVNTASAKKVFLILNGVDLKKAGGAVINIISSPEKTEIKSVNGSVNILSDDGEHSVNSDGDDCDAVIYSKDDLILEGEGTVYINADYDKGIHSKDDIKIKSGEYKIISKGDGISGKNKIEMSGGSVVISSDGDGMVSNREEDGKESGYIVISGGSVDITTGGGAKDTAGGNDFGGGFPGGGGARPPRPGEWGGGYPGDNGQNSNDDSAVSTKGIKVTGYITVSGGSIKISSLDDSLHSNADITVSGGTHILASGDDGIHAENKLDITNGNIYIEKSYEGIEGRYITFQGGYTEINSSDDGINAVDTSSTSSGGWGGGFGGSSDCLLTINSGYIVVYASGDGVDSNGNIVQNGGTVIVFGPENSGNGAIDTGDRNCSYEINGGTVLAVGAAGMAEGVDPASNVASFNYTSGKSNISAGSLVYVLNKNGDCVLAFNTPKRISSIVYASSTLEKSTFSIYVGGSCEGEILNNVYQSPDPSGGSKIN